MESNLNIEDRSIRISLKMAWAVIGSLVVGSLSLAGVYFGVMINITALKSDQKTIDAVQNLQLENIKLNATKTEIDLREFQRKLDLKEDKKK